MTPFAGWPCTGPTCTTCSTSTPPCPLLQRLVAVTGVSGSGKSTLARDVLLASVQALVTQRATRAGRDAMAAGSFPRSPAAPA
jgi:hypothetical protein